MKGEKGIIHRCIVMTALVLVAPFVFWACTMITPKATADQVEKMLVAADFKFNKELARERKVEYKDTLYESQDEELIPDVGWDD